MDKSFSLYAILLSLVIFAAPAYTHAQRVQTGNNLAPGAPGLDAQWTNAGKEAVGTSNTVESKVWFTLRGGVLDEVYYPTVDVANTRTLQFIVTGCRNTSVEGEGATNRIEVLDTQSLSFRQTSETNAYTITKTYTTDPERPVVLIDVEFKGRCRALQRLYVYYDPSLNNSGMHDSAWTEGGALLASDADKASALVSSTGFDETTNGYFGTSDKLDDLLKRGFLTEHYARAADGNVVQIGEVSGAGKFTLALAFGREPAEALKNARLSLAKGFAKVRAEYEAGWHDYVKTLRHVDAKYQAQYDMAALVLKAHEDKTFRGAMIASLSIPWGGGSNANEPNVGGYHLVWARDLYQVATAFYAVGDKASADRALDYLFRVQQKADGSFPQNSWLDGRPFWGSLQLDEVSFPLVLAYQLGRTDNETYVKHVRPAADFIVKNGPFTPQERWEEKSGYSPSTIAAEIAGLTCAAEIARRNGDDASAVVYIAAADDFARNVERWTATTTGTYGDKNYYLRLSFNDDPDDGAPFNVGNGGGEYDEREIVDAGFLELVRLGIRPPQDPLIAKSVAVIDQVIKVDTPVGASFYRYNHDGYGEMDDGREWNWDGKYTGKGRLWALLAGERGEYELALGRKTEAARRLDALAGFANEGRMIPEQVWDRPESPRPDFKFGEGTGSATPLAWSMAQFVRLATNLQEGRNIDTPDIVAARYAKPSPPPRAVADFNFPAKEILERMKAGESFRVTGGARAQGSRAFVLTGDERRELKPDAGGDFSFDVTAAARGTTPVVIGVIAPSGATYFQRAYAGGHATGELERAGDGDPYPTDAPEHLKSVKTSPLVEGEDVTFVYRGEAKRVEVVGDFTGWSPAGLVLRDAPGTNVKYIRLKFPRSARLEYKLIADGEWMLDPLNPSRNNNGVGGQNSNFVGPDYRPAPNAQGRDELRGRLERLALTGDDKRKVQVYLPPGYTEGRARYPVLYMQDGTQFIELGRAAEIADRMIVEGKIEPFIIIFIDPLERMKEYWANDQFADWMAQTLVPLVDSRYRTRAEREGRALSGASLGGVISVWTALRHPDVFARVGGQSSAFQIDEERVIAALARLDDEARRKYPLRFYFDAGRYEPLIIDAARRVNVMLRARGYPVTYREAAVGHNYTAWRDRLADAYTALWAK
ncbi:MAG: glucoamylase [Acidobacteriota bacterium]|jgi:glucoamylase|nr:glucoamylase [Acidobacteriota bacterium]